MNKIGQASVGFGIIFGILIFMVGSLAIDFLKDDITLARGSTNLDCSNSSISDGTKLTCLGVDIIVPYFFLLILSLLGVLLVGRFIGK